MVTTILPLARKVDFAARSVQLATLIVVLIFLEQASFTYRNRSTHGQPPRLHRSSASVATAIGRQGVAQRQRGSNLVYWTPHKTGSTSMRTWLKTVAAALGADVSGAVIHYPYLKIGDHEERLQYVSNNVSCTLVMGHIRVPAFSERYDERRLGAVITTTRHAFNTLASKFFHRTDDSLTDDALRSLATTRSARARRWFYYWHDSNACEALEYYDGVRDCRLDGDDVEDRARRIAERIDCAVDMDDAEEDADALCAQLGLLEGTCPRFPTRNTERGESRYRQLYRLAHVTQVMQNNLYVADVLRRHLMAKRCRFLASGNLTSREFGAPRWPSVACKNRGK